MQLLIKSSRTLFVIRLHTFDRKNPHTNTVPCVRAYTSACFNYYCSKAHINNALYYMFQIIYLPISIYEATYYLNLWSNDITGFGGNSNKKNWDCSSSPLIINILQITDFLVSKNVFFVVSKCTWLICLF